MVNKPKFDKLLIPSFIGKVKTRNRIIKTAATTNFAIDNHINEKYLTFYESLARGGVGLIIAEPIAADKILGTHGSHEWYLDEADLPKYAELTRNVHQQGCPIFIELFHSGAWRNPSLREIQPISSSLLTKSDLPDTLIFSEARELTIPEIKDIVQKFASTAEMARKAGFDGVEINSSTCHLLNSFLSRYWNKRRDDYGIDTLENRSRIVVEIIRAIKERLGKDFPVIALFNGMEYGLDRGTTLEESKGFARIFQDAGADALEVRIYGYGDYTFTDYPEEFFYPEPPERRPEMLRNRRHGAGLCVPFVGAIKQVVSIPVIAVGRLDPRLGETILLEGKADFIGMTRRLLADPELPNKLVAGKMDDIAPCVACTHCLSALSMDKPIVCRVNASLGEDVRINYRQAEKKKKVLVVGGGPAGMEAARIAAMRGHEVILYEREHRLGGSLPLAAMVKGFEIEDLTSFINYLKTQINRLGVKIVLGKEADAAVVGEIKPDAVIMATGGTPVIPEIPGIHRGNVVDIAELRRQLKFYLGLLGPKALRWLTKLWMPLGKKVVIIGGGIQGCQLAEFLINRGRQVTIVENAEAIGGDVPLVKWLKLLPWLNKKGVNMVTGAKYEEITDKGLVVTTKEGKRQTLEAESIISALPLYPNNEFFKALEGKVPEIYMVGDCKEPRLIIDAIAAGNHAARTI